MRRLWLARALQIERAARADSVHAVACKFATALFSAQPIHWIYGEAALRTALEGIDATPEFRPVSANPFYRLPTGRQSGYGDQAIVLLRHCRELALASRQRPGDAAPPLAREAYAAAVASHFGPGTEYDPTATTEYHVDGSPSGRTRRYEASKVSKWPISGPWMHHCIKDFNAAVARGDAWPQGSKDDKQADAAAKVAAVVCLHAGHIARARAAGDAGAADGALQVAVDEATRTTQDDDLVVSSARLVARVILECLLGAPPADAIAAAIAHMRDASRPGQLVTDEACAAAAAVAVAPAMLARSHQVVVDELGNTCKLMNSMQTPLHVAAAAPQDEPAVDAFVSAIRATMVARGCNCSRLCIAGAVLGATLGAGAVPEDWTARTLEAADIKRSADSIAEFAATQLEDRV